MLNRLVWFGRVQRMEKNGVPKRVLYMNLETTRLRGRPRNRWQDEVTEVGRIVGGDGWLEKVHNREEWKKLLRRERNRHILHMPREWMNYPRFSSCRKLLRSEVLNLLKPTGHVMHHQFNIQQLYALPTLYLCVLYLSENKQRLVPLTA